MKREILFRGKSVEYGEWVYGGLVVDDGRAHIVRQITQHIKRDDYECYAINVEPETIGQFTGLIDKNGKKIFENDILADGAVVKWFDELFWDGGGSTHPGFYCEKWASCGELSWLERFDNDCEIIGNVSDNPELVAKND